MPELPEVQALVDFLGGRMAGRVITDLELGSIAVLKTFDPAPDALVGAPVDSVARHGKFVDIDADGTHLVFHLARAGWLRWMEEVRGIATLGPDPLADDFTQEVFAGILQGRRTQVKGLLRDQSVIAGVGNAYSDEILHAARLSPFALAASLTPEQVEELYVALRTTLEAAVMAAEGKPAAELKDAKRAGMNVHGRTGEACPVCGGVVHEVSFADTSLQYCPTCQTGGKPLADRRMSRLLK